MTKTTNTGGGAIPVSPLLVESEEHGQLEPRPKLVNKRLLLLSLQAIFNAIVIGFIAKALVGLIALITNLAFYQRFSFEETSPVANTLGLLVIVVPVIGGIIVGILARYGSAAIRGHGIPEAMEQVLSNESKIKPIITFLKPVSAAIAIGTGGPFGAEGPIIATGGAFGSGSGQIMRVSANERKIMLAAGACAGMAAIFGSPIAAVLLAIELLLFEFSPRSIIPVALSCATGAAMHFALFGTDPAFMMQPLPDPSSMAMVVYTGMGLIIGVAAALVSKSVYLVEDLFEHIPIHWMWWPAIGAVAVGVVGYFAPYTLGVGYENITHLLSGSLSIQLMLGLCFLKFISWVVSLGSGTSGGTLAPLLTIGGAFGALLGVCILQVFPGADINIPTCALIGMAAMFAGASRALLTAIIFAFETTAQPHGLLPLLAACTASYFISFFLMKGTIMTEKIERRGVFTPNAFEPDMLQKIAVSEVYVANALALSVANTVREAREWVKANAIAAIDFTVVTVDGELCGVIKRTDLFNKSHNDDSPISGLITSQYPFIYEDSKLDTAIDLMVKYGNDTLPVVAKGPQKMVIGTLSHKEIFNAYRKRHHENETYERAISLKRQGIKIILKGKELLQR